MVTDQKVIQAFAARQGRKPSKRKEQFERRGIPPRCRLELPLYYPGEGRKIADLLRGLANQFENQSQRTGTMEDFRLASMNAMEVKHTQTQLNELEAECKLTWSDG